MSDLNRKLAEALGFEVTGELLEAAPHWTRWIHVSQLSTTWDGAGLVVDAMRERGQLLDLADAGKHFQAHFIKEEFAPMVCAPTAPEAIAKAALAALQQEVTG